MQDNLSKKELRKANEEKDGAEKRCLQVMNELEQTKRTSFFEHSVCKMCHIAIHSLKDNSRASLKKSKALSKAKNNLDEQFETHRKEEGSSIISVRKFEEKL